jgi:hypothetical protein
MEALNVGGAWPRRPSLSGRPCVGGTLSAIIHHRIEQRRNFFTRFFSMTWWILYERRVRCNNDICILWRTLYLINVRQFSRRPIIQTLITIYTYFTIFQSLCFETNQRNIDRKRVHQRDRGRLQRGRSGRGDKSSQYPQKKNAFPLAAENPF